MLQILVLVAVLAVMLLGIAGAVVPVLPSTPVILLAAFIYALVEGFTEITWPVLVTLLVLTLVSQLLDYLAGVYGAQKMGASRAGMVGAFIGAIIGLFFGLVGIVIGPFVGAFAGEILIGKKDVTASLKSGAGALLGLLGGTLGKLVIAVIMVGVFIISLF